MFNTTNIVNYLHFVSVQFGSKLYVELYLHCSCMKNFINFPDIFKIRVIRIKYNNRKPARTLLINVIIYDKFKSFKSL